MRAFTKAAALAAVLAFAAIAVILPPVAAFAQQAASSAPAVAETTSVNIPWGDVIGQLGVDLLPWAGLAVLTLITGLLPAPVRALVQKYRTSQVDQLLERALGFAAATMQDRIKGQAINIETHNALVAKAAQYAVDHGAKAVLDFAGQAGLKDKLSARVLTSPAVQSAQGSISPAFPSATAK